MASILGPNCMYIYIYGVYIGIPEQAKLRKERDQVMAQLHRYVYVYIYIRLYWIVGLTRRIVHRAATEQAKLRHTHTCIYIYIHINIWI